MVHVASFRNCERQFASFFSNFENDWDSALFNEDTGPCVIYFHEVSCWFMRRSLDYFEYLDGKIFEKPRLPFEKERLDAELKLVVEYGLHKKRELWRVQYNIQYALSRICNNAPMLLTLDKINTRRIFVGGDLLLFMNRVGKQIIDVSLLSRSGLRAKNTDFPLSGPLGGGTSGRVKRNNMKAASKKASGGDDEDDE